MNPFALFKSWFDLECHNTNANVPAACCLSTIGMDGYPNARIVSLKEVLDEKFVITGSQNSRKGREIEKSDKIALTFWWPKTERQVRIQGNAEKIPSALADKYFEERNIPSQITSLVCQQGSLMPADNYIDIRISHLQDIARERKLPRPQHWGGYFILPFRMEFMQFKIDRFHDRKLFQLDSGTWNMVQLQP